MASCSGEIVNSTVCVSPAASVTRWKPTNVYSGSPGCGAVWLRYSCTTSSASTWPTFVTFTVTGTGFSSTVRGTVRSDPVDLGTQQPDSSGTVRFTFPTADLAPGAHTVTLRSEESTVVVAFTVVGPSTLASAGADVPPAALAGAIVALVAGIGLLVSSRRRAR